MLQMHLSAQPWQAYTPEPGGDYHWYNLSVIDQDTAWFMELTGSITHTDDGGATWETHALGDWDPYYENFYLYPMGAASASHAYIQAGLGIEVAILETQDGGATWSEAFANGGFAEQDNIMLGIHFFNDQEGVAIANSNYEEALFYTLHTTDGGLTWDSTAVDSLGGYDFLYTYDVAGDTLWVSSYNGVFLQSTDRGHTWTPQTLPGSGFVGAIAMTNGHEGALLIDEDIYYTSNGGQQWELRGTQPSEFPYDTWLTGIKGRSGAFITFNRVEGRMDLSQDTCQNWGLNVKPSRYAGLGGVKFVSPNAGWAASGGNGVFKWSNPEVILETLEPEYTSLKTKHTGNQSFGARLALWTAAPDTYDISYRVLRDNVLAYQTADSVHLTPGFIYPSFVNFLPTNPGEYSYVTHVFKNNLLLETDTFFQHIGDSVIAKGVGIGDLFRYDNDRGNLVVLAEPDTLSSIHLPFFVNEYVPFDPQYTCNIEFWVFGQDSLTGLYTEEFYRSAPMPVPLDTNNFVTVSGVRALFIDLLYQLPDTLILPAGSYVIGSLGSGSPFRPYAALDTRTIYEQAVWNGTHPELVTGWGYAPPIEANFGFKQAGTLATGDDLAAGLRVFPNPAQDRLTFDVVQTLPGSPWHMRLFDLTGQEVLSQPLSAGTQTFSVADLPPGVYMWYVTGGNGRAVAGRVVIE